MKAGDCI